MTLFVLIYCIDITNSDLIYPHLPPSSARPPSLSWPQRPWPWPTVGCRSCTEWTSPRPTWWSSAAPTLPEPRPPVFCPAAAAETTAVTNPNLLLRLRDRLILLRLRQRRLPLIPPPRPPPQRLRLPLIPHRRRRQPKPPGSTTSRPQPKPPLRIPPPRRVTRNPLILS